VFDWAWADAYRRHGLRYYPKLLGAESLHASARHATAGRDAAARVALAQAVRKLADESGLSSAHILLHATMQTGRRWPRRDG
jgi:predicted N-acyltransferase